jgi:CheY-like chemotaxis protein
VRELADGTDFESVVGGFRPDLAVLDLMLPGRDGYALARALRSHGDTAVLLLTARDAVPDRVRGLRSGADNYVFKPFAIEEVLARVGAILRRLGRAPATVQVGGLARAHGGDLTYHDTGPGTGACFRLTLPAGRVAAPRPAWPGCCPTPAPAPAPAPSFGTGGTGGTPGAGRSSPGASEGRG